MTRLLVFISLLATIRLVCQSTLTKDSFFLEQKSFPKNYQSIIKDTPWLFMGRWQSNKKKIYVPDTIRTIDLMLFEDKLVRQSKNFRRHVVVVKDTSELSKTVKVYHKIKGRKIVSNTDFATEKIIYVDNSTLILETKNKKIRHRALYRRQT